jgi:hypothetical protein
MALSQGKSVRTDFSGDDLRAAILRLPDVTKS